MSSILHDPGEDVGGRKVFLATTAYDSPDATYTYSLARSREYLHKNGIGTAYTLLSGNCHVDDSRNTVIKEFLQSDCDDLVFLDADVSWEPEHLLALCGYDCDVVGGVYPYRRDGADGMPVRNMNGCFEPDEGGLLEVEGLPTGFLRIKRHVIEKMTDGAEKFSKNGEDIPILFERDVLNGGRRGGDIGFCMKWREMGGQVYAAANLRLGHCGKMVMKDSLAAHLRRQAGTSLAFVARELKSGNDDRDLFHEAVMAAPNVWGARSDTLRLASLMARKSAGPILEAGSGLSTVLMAAAASQTVWCIEHNPFYARRTEYLAAQAGVTNIAIVTCPIKNGWYDLSEDMDSLPKAFSLAMVDGPPRLEGDRMRFFEVFGGRCKTFIVDDADDAANRAAIEKWAADNGMAVRMDAERSAVILPQSLLEAA